MKWLFIIFLFPLYQLSLIGQNVQETNWIISVNLGIQQHDKRLFDYSEKEMLLEMHKGFFGTYQFGIRGDRSIHINQLLEASIGLGISAELSTFTRPFDHFYKRNFSQIKILPNTNRYYKSLIQLPLVTTFRIRKKMRLSMEILPQYSFLTIADNSENSPLGSISWWGFNFHSLEFNPGVIWSTENIDFGLKYRVFQIKRIDKILFNDIIDDPRTDQNVETYNPFKIWLSFGYRLQK